MLRAIASPEENRRQTKCDNKYKQQTTQISADQTYPNKLDTNSDRSAS